MTSTAVLAERVRTLYRQSVAIMIMNPLNAAVVAAVLWPRRGRGSIVAWVGAIAAVAVLRAALRRSYLRAAPPPEEAPRWAWRHALGSFAAGALWGLGSALLYGSRDAAAELILVFTVAGMAAGAAGTLAYHLPSFIAYAAPALLLLAVRMVVEGDRLHLAMGGLVLAYGGVLAAVALNTNRAITEAFRLRFENEALLGRLRGAQASLEESNRTLEQRVAERGAALERQADALREARRMESLGLLAGGVAHDFNNLLTVIVGNASVVLSDERIDTSARESLEEIRTAAERASSLVRQLLAFSRRQPRRARIVDLNTVVSGAERFLGRLLGANVELRVARFAGPLAVEVDPVQLEQVIINLATNARDAMGAGGRLSIETASVELPGAESDPALATVRPGAYAVLSVRDTGVGMDAETRRKAFHPFFTTKEVGQGTGLGLATVHGIVEQSGGHVSVDSEPGKGTCFQVFLPLSTASIGTEVGGTAGTAPDQTAGAAADNGPAATPRPATILVVEDDAMVRAVTTRALARAGFTIIEAENGEQALERVRAHDGTIDLLVTDVVMSGMGGPALARELGALRPGIRALFVSGHSRSAALPMADPPAGVDFLGKPFTPDVLVSRVTRLLAGEPSPPPPSPDAPMPFTQRR